MSRAGARALATSTSRRGPVAVALLVAAAGFALTWIGYFPPVDETGCMGRVEGSSSHTEPAGWPPGARRCVIDGPDGTHVETEAFPFRDLLLVAFLAAGAGLAAAAPTSPLRRGAALLVLAAGAVAVGVVGWSL